MQEKHLEPNTTQWFIKYTWGDSMYKFSKSLWEEKSVLVVEEVMWICHYSKDNLGTGETGLSGQLLLRLRDGWKLTEA